jgi:hypothetical protein
MDLGGGSIAPDTGTVMMSVGMAASEDNEAALGTRMLASMGPGSFAMDEHA